MAFAGGDIIASCSIRRMDRYRTDVPKAWKRMDMSAATTVSRGKSSINHVNSNSSTAGYCKSHGCGIYHKGWPCQCVDSCSKYKNCCADFGTECNSPATPPAGCKKASKGSKCDKAVHWVIDTGMKEHPDWYKGLKSDDPHTYTSERGGYPGWG